jgi:hypothetical protein
MFEPRATDSLTIQQTSARPISTRRAVVYPSTLLRHDISMIRVVRRRHLCAAVNAHRMSCNASVLIVLEASKRQHTAQKIQDTVIGGDAAFDDALKLEQSKCTLLAIAFVTRYVAVCMNTTTLAAKLNKIS